MPLGASGGASGQPPAPGDLYLAAADLDQALMKVLALAAKSTEMSAEDMWKVYELVRWHVGGDNEGTAQVRLEAKDWFARPEFDSFYDVVHSPKSSGDEARHAVSRPRKRGEARAEEDHSGRARPTGGFRGLGPRPDGPPRCRARSPINQLASANAVNVASIRPSESANGQPRGRAARGDGVATAPPRQRPAVQRDRPRSLRVTHVRPPGEARRLGLLVSDPGPRPSTAASAPSTPAESSSPGATGYGYLAFGTSYTLPRSGLGR